MPDQSLAFGSVWEGATIDDGFNTVYTDIKKGLDSYLPKQKFIERLSAIYAFDLFVHNEDRHSGNYLFRPSFDTHVMLAMDFSRSWTNLNCPIDRTSAVMNPTRLPMQYISPPHHINQNGNKSNTSLLAGFLWNIQQLGPICGGTFFKTLNLLLELTQMHINSILSKVPEEWCSSKRKDIIRNWWLSGEHINRINIIKGAYEHGTLV